ncbi:MAG: hypothetical protein V4581_18175 [Bacteroidota bacterium]
MKKSICLLLFAGLFAVSCSSDDSGDTGASGNTYLPLNTGNFWVYDVENETSQTNGRDSLYIANDTLIGSTTYKKFKTESLANGFFSGALSGNGVRQIGTRLQLTGSTGFSFSEEFPVALSVSNFIFFDSEAPSGTQLGITTGSFSQATEDGYTLSFDYTLAAVAGANSASYTVPGGPSYTNVKAAQLNLTLKITAMFDFNGISIPVEVLPQQQVLASTQYYAQNIGAVYVDTNIEYHLADQLSTFNITLPIPSSGSEHQEEVLDTYNVN